MANDARAVVLNVDEIAWTEFVWVSGGGGFSQEPELSPFLWTIFFKADADGNECFFTDGDHRDLGVASVNPGAVMSIDSSLGSLAATPARRVLADRRIDYRRPRRAAIVTASRLCRPA